MSPGATPQRTVLPTVREELRDAAPAPSARERILAAAVRRIALEGIDGVRIARIAIDAGVSPPLVHYHFDSREALLAEALNYSYTRAGDARIADGGHAPGASHAERLRAMVDQCLPTTPGLAEDWVLWVELWLRAVRHPELAPVAEELYGRLQRWFAKEVQAGIDNGEFAHCDVPSVVDRTLALLDGCGIRALVGDTAMTLDRAREIVWATLARDLGIAENPTP